MPLCAHFTATWALQRSWHYHMCCSAGRRCEVHDLLLYGSGVSTSPCCCGINGGTFQTTTCVPGCCLVDLEVEGCMQALFPLQHFRGLSGPAAVPCPLRSVVVYLLVSNRMSIWRGCSCCWLMHSEHHAHAASFLGLFESLMCEVEGLDVGSSWSAYVYISAAMLGVQRQLPLPVCCCGRPNQHADPCVFSHELFAS